MAPVIVKIILVICKVAEQIMSFLLLSSCVIDMTVLS